MGIQTNDNNVFKKKKKEKGTGRLVLGKDRPVVLQKTQKRLEETKREKSLAKETGKREWKLKDRECERKKRLELEKWTENTLFSLCNCKKSENPKEFEILINSNSNNSNVSFILSSLITNSTFSSFSFPFQLQPSLPSSSSHFFYNVHVSIFSNTTPSTSQTKQYSPLSSLFLFHVCWELHSYFPGLFMFLPSI